jgi:hypothetical protein
VLGSPSFERLSVPSASYSATPHLQKNSLRAIHRESSSAGVRANSQATGRASRLGFDINTGSESRIAVTISAFLRMPTRARRFTPAHLAGSTQDAREQSPLIFLNRLVATV